MPHALRIESVPISPSGRQDTFEFVTRHPAIVASAQALMERGAAAFRFPADQPGVYVFQKEYAVVPRAKACIIGSDRATTCHILIAASPHRVFCAHLDGSHGQTKVLLAALRDAFSAAESLHLHLAGGFADDRGLSVELGRELLTALDRGWPGVRFDLKTACIGPLNTIATAAPAIRALAWDVRTNVLVPNGWFNDRGPNVEWRAARASYGTAPLVRATDPDTGEYGLDPSDTISVPEKRHLQALLRMDDDRTLLQMSSTSPDVEHEGFCAETRATLRYLLRLK